MGKSILIIGGARSGKSTLAESMALALGVPASYIATAEAPDDEMADPISKHQSRRGPEWQTLAEPLDLSRALRESDGQGPRLVDCLTLWLSNLMFAERDWETETQAMLNTVSNQASPVIFVTNEVGGGIVPENKLARQFRDAADIMNQQVAATCDEVWLCVAGLPVKVKPA